MNGWAGTRDETARLGYTVARQNDGSEPVGLDYQGDSVGAQQTENYWLRNRKMFENMQEAIAARDAKRVLVIVGSGHKYVLDELTREAGYRQVAPREWLPAPHADTNPETADNRGGTPASAS